MSKKFKEIKLNDHKITSSGNTISISKNNKTVNCHLPTGVTYEINNNSIQFFSENKALLGTAESTCFNAIRGLNQFYEKKIKVVGVGYKMMLKGKTLQLSLGFSHVIEVNIPDNVDIKLEGVLNATLSSPDAILLGDIVAKIEKLKYNVYKGTGVINVAKEAAGLMRRKEGKKK